MTGNPHVPICGECFEAWPCLAHRQYGQRLWKARQAQDACHRCDKPVTGMRVEVRGGGILGENVRYHGRQGACRKVGLKHLADMLIGAADPLLRLELERERERIDQEALRTYAEREARRLLKAGGIIISREEMEDRLVTVTRLVDGDCAVEWRKGTSPPDDLVLFAASRQRGFELAEQALENKTGPRQ